MAMRHQRGGRHGANRPRVGPRPVYEDFKPVTEWKHEEKSDILLVYLPGFTKEQLKVSTEGTNTLRIRGERLVGGNKWSRFQEDTTIPGSCDIKSIRAKYEGGVLTVTMPKINTASSSSQPGPKHELEAKTTATKPGAVHPLPHPPALPLPPAPQQVQPTHDKPRYEDVQEVRKKANANGKKTLSDQSSSTSSSSSSSDDDEKKKVAAAETSKLPQKTGDKGRETQLPTVITDDRRGQNDVISKPGTVLKETLKKQTEEIAETAPAAAAADSKEKKTESIAAATSSGGGALSAAPGGLGGLYLDKYKRAVKEKLANRTQLSEERQLLVNMGVAVLVIVALGAYISYNYGPSRND